MSEPAKWLLFRSLLHRTLAGRGRGWNQQHHTDLSLLISLYEQALMGLISQQRVHDIASTSTVRERMTKVLVVDDHESLRRSISFLLECNSFEVCGEAVSVEDAVKKVADLKPDVQRHQLTYSAS
jgi:hypothetical protein